MWFVALILFLLIVGRRNFHTSTIIPYLIVGILIFFSAFRYRVGLDTISYNEFYESISVDRRFRAEDSRFEYIWGYIFYFTKKYLDSFYWIQIFQAAVLNILVYWYISRCTVHRYQALLLYILTIYLYFNTEILRESVAISFSLFAFFYLNRSLLKYFGYSCIAVLFHNSAIVLFVLGAVVLLSKWKYSRRFLVGLFFLFFFNAEYLFEYAVNFSLMSLSNTSRASIYLELQDSWSLNGKIFAFVAHFVVPMIVFYKLKSSKLLTNEEKIVFYFFLFLGSLTLYNITIFSRLFNYFAIPLIVYYSRYLDLNRQRFVLRWFFISVLLFLEYYPFFKNEARVDTIFYRRYFPYTTVVSEELVRDRENVYKINQE